MKKSHSKQTGYIIAFLLLCSGFSLKAQDLVGRWIVEDVIFSYTRKSTEAERQQLPEFRKIYLKETKGKLIRDYKNNGLLYMLSVDGTDTSEFGEYKWWTKGNRIFTNNTKENKEDITTYELKQNVLYITSTEKSFGLLLKEKYVKCPGQSKSNHSNNSLTYYYSAGIASIDKKWTNEEYRDAAIILRDLDEKKILPLPNHNDSSIAILRKLTNYEAMEFLNSKDPLSSNDVYLLGSFSVAMGQLLRMYLIRPPNKQEGYYSQEITSIQITILKLADKIIELNATMPEKSFPVNWQKDKNKRKASLNELVEGCLMTMQEEAYTAYDANDICNFGKAFFNFYNKNQELLDIKPGTYSAGMLEKLKTHPLPCLRKLSGGK